jgi:hypothetical protein
MTEPGAHVTAADKVLDLLMSGVSPHEAGRLLAVEHTTLNNRLGELRRRYGVTTTVQVVALAWKTKHDAVAARLEECERFRRQFDRRGRDRG